MSSEGIKKKPTTLVCVNPQAQIIKCVNGINNPFPPFLKDKLRTQIINPWGMIVGTDLLML